MPKREQLFREIEPDTHFGVLLLAQLDAVPETLQLIVTTTRLDPVTGGLHDIGQYVIRAIGVVEHKLSLGLFTAMVVRDTHPLLYQYNTAPVALFFRGKASDPAALFADTLQAYATTFGPWRQPPTYLNTTRPLLALLSSEGDLLGQMPAPLADAMIPALESQGLETRAMAEETPDVDDHGRSRLRKVLLMDDSYIVAFDFTIESLGKL